LRPRAAMRNIRLERSFEGGIGHGRRSHHTEFDAFAVANGQQTCELL
jgi:hypothetical protein